MAACWYVRRKKQRAQSQPQVSEPEYVTGAPLHNRNSELQVAGSGKDYLGPTLRRELESPSPSRTGTDIRVPPLSLRWSKWTFQRQYRFDRSSHESVSRRKPIKRFHLPISVYVTRLDAWKGSYGLLVRLCTHQILLNAHHGMLVAYKLTSAVRSHTWTAVPKN